MRQHTLLAGRYELLSPLGRGGMGQVWEAEDQRLERRVAAKLLADDVLAARTEPDELARRFAREAAVTAGLQHPGVPAVYDAGTYDAGLFLVLELIAGRTLGDLVAEEGPLPTSWAAGIAAQVAAVLAAAHERGLIHRDVKPQNVMVTGDGTVKVLDFGVATLIDHSGLSRITRTGQTIGTPAYMAPEQLQGRPATPRSDLYALGCVLYEMLSGEPIFESSTPAGLMHQHLEQAPAPLRREDLHPGLNSLVRQLLEKDPARRPADAQETYDRLLPYIVSPGPLGEIDAGADRKSGMHLYSNVLVRLSGRTGSRTHGRGAADLNGTGAGPVGPSGAGTAQRADVGGHPPWVPVAPGPSPRPVDGAVPMVRPAGPGPAPMAGPPWPPGPPTGMSPHPPITVNDSVAGGGHQGWHGGDRGPYGPRLPHLAAGGIGNGTSPPRAHGYGWKVLHSLWMLPTLLFGITTWLSFGYIAARHRRPSWLVAAAAYLVLDVTAFALVGTGPDNVDTPGTTTGMVIGLILWPAGFLHALWVNARVHLPTRAQARRS